MVKLKLTRLGRKRVPFALHRALHFRLSAAHSCFYSVLKARTIRNYNRRSGIRLRFSDRTQCLHLIVPDGDLCNKCPHTPNGVLPPHYLRQCWFDAAKCLLPCRLKTHAEIPTLWRHGASLIVPDRCHLSLRSVLIYCAMLSG